MRHYELMMVVNPDVDDEGVEALKERVRRFVTDNGGQLTSEDHWGKRKLAYRIGSHIEGNYFLAQLDLEPAPAKALEGNLNMAEDVIRHMLVLHEQ